MRSNKARIGITGKGACKALALAIAIAASLPMHGSAAEPETARDAVVNFSIPAGDLSVALEKFSTQSGIQAMYRQDLVAGRRAHAVSGSMTPAVALAQLLQGTGVGSERVNEKTYVIKLAPPPAPKKEGESQQKAMPATTMDDGVRDFDKMVVVGSRLGTSPVESAMPIKVITADQIDRSGAGNIAQVLSYLSEVSVNNIGDRTIGLGDGVGTGGNTNSTIVQLRGLPKGSTLVLINGRRSGESASYTSDGIFDLSTIPLSLVERIEVLPAGSSAIYGGDGLAGVINVVLKRDASGLEVRMRHSAADGHSGTVIGATWGKAWRKGNITLSASAQRSTPLYNGERELTANQDYSRFGGRDRRRAAANPANVYSLDGCPSPPAGCFIPLQDRANLPGLDSPVAFAPNNSSGAGLTVDSFTANQGTQNRSSGNYHFISGEKNYTFNLNGNWQIGSAVEGFVEATYTWRNVPAYQVPISIEYGEYGLSDYGAVMAAENPYNPFGVDIGVSYLFKNTGLYTSYSQRYRRSVLGLRGRISDFSWEVSRWESTDHSRTDGPPFFDVEALREALSSSDPARAFNPFVSNGGLPVSSDVLPNLLGPLREHSSSSRTTGLTGYIQGRLMALPAGNVIGLIGLESQAQKVYQNTNNTAFLTMFIDGETKSRAVFGEFRLPLLSARKKDSHERLAITGAVRRESSDRYEDPMRTETVGLEFRPDDRLLLRATYGSAFRPPLAYRTIEEPYYVTAGVRDPQFGGNTYIVSSVGGGGMPPGIRPEASTNRTVGATFRPSDALSIAVTAWESEIVDRITTVSAQTVVDYEQYYPGRVLRDPQTGLIQQVDTRRMNIALTSAAGVDLGIEGQKTTEFGNLIAGLSATYTHKHESKVTKDSPIQNTLAALNSAGWAPKWKIVPRIGWDSHGAIRGLVTGRYVSSYRDSAALSSGLNAGKYLELGSFWLVDLNVSIALESMFPSASLLSNSHVNIGSTNIFNRLPSFCAGCGDRGYDTTQYDIVGRTIYAEVRVSF